MKKMSNRRPNALLEKYVFFKCVKKLLTISSIKQKIRNHYAKMCPGWEETES